MTLIYSHSIWSRTAFFIVYKLVNLRAIKQNKLKFSDDLMLVYIMVENLCYDCLLSSVKDCNMELNGSVREHGITKQNMESAERNNFWVSLVNSDRADFIWIIDKFNHQVFATVCYAEVVIYYDRIDEGTFGESSSNWNISENTF